MIRTIFFMLSFTLICQACLAETCPSINDVKTKVLHGWKAYDSDDGAPLSPLREAQFKQTIQEFALAEWPNKENKNGTIHCYYRDKTGSSLEAYLAKDHFVPLNHKNYWYEVSGYLHCAAGMDKCEFNQRMLAKQKQLARK